MWAGAEFPHLHLHEIGSTDCFICSSRCAVITSKKTSEVMELIMAWMSVFEGLNRFATINRALVPAATCMARSGWRKCGYLRMNIFLSNTPWPWPLLTLLLWTTVVAIKSMIVWREDRMDRCVNLMVVDGAIDVMFEFDIPLERSAKGWFLLSKLCVICEWMSWEATWAKWETVGAL